MKSEGKTGIFFNRVKKIYEFEIIETGVFIPCIR